MLGLPQSTEVKRPLPKAQLYKRFDWKPSQRESFDGEVSRLDFVNWIAPRTLPAIAEGAEVKEIFVIEVTLKTRDFDPKNIVLLAKSIPQHVIYLLRFEDEAMLAVYYMRLFLTPWQPAENISIGINGLNLNGVWGNVVRQIVGTSLCDVSNSDTSQVQHAVREDAVQQIVGTLLCDVSIADASPVQHAEGMSLQEQIETADRRAKIERQIAALERHMNATKQPRRKRELFLELQKLKCLHKKYMNSQNNF